jgi:hypothetical protein
MHRQARSLSTLLVVAAFGLLTMPRVASAVPVVISSGTIFEPVVFSDGTFLDAEWTTSVFATGLGGSGGAAQASTGGNPDFFRAISITLVQPTSTTGSRVDVVSIKPTALYDPSSQAGITYVDYSEDAILLDGSGNGHALTIALEQAGVIYAGLPRLVSPDLVWTAKSIPGLVATDFIAISGGSGTPDFSTSGAVIAFGFWRAFSSPTGSSGGTRIGGIDNWMVTVHSIPEPASALMIGLGIAMICVSRRAEAS